MCGEHTVDRPTKKDRMGSSPHVRGTLHTIVLHVAPQGIIPACAGNTYAATSTGVTCGDHPRMCGEHPVVPDPHSSMMGSSPHVRGTHRGRWARCSRAGIIPACAGNTRAAAGWRASRRDHPRMCGEHALQPYKRGLALGSSPHVRGTLRGGEDFVGGVGIIPACAGNTRVRKGRDGRAGDHPRMCGEHNPFNGIVADFPGSSPHVRGTLRMIHHWSDIKGIIPACAGNTQTIFEPTCSMRDHPRMCGEHGISPSARRAVWGSSPHVRGTLTNTYDNGGLTGIIPACAGNTGESAC